MHGVLSSAQRAGGLTVAAHAVGMNSRTYDGVLGTNRNLAVLCALDTGCPGPAGASCSTASTVTVPSLGPVPAAIVNDAGNPKSSLAPVRVHARGCAVVVRVVPADTSTRSDKTRSRASVSTMTSTAVAGLVHDESAVVATSAAAASFTAHVFISGCASPPAALDGRVVPPSLADPSLFERARFIRRQTITARRRHGDRARSAERPSRTSCDRAVYRRGART